MEYNYAPPVQNFNPSAWPSMGIRNPEEYGVGVFHPGHLTNAPAKPIEVITQSAPVRDLDSEAAAEYLGTSRWVLWQGVHHEGLQFEWRGRRKYYSREELDAWVKRRGGFTRAAGNKYVLVKSEPKQMEMELEPIKSDGGATDYYKLPEHATELRHLISHKGMSKSRGDVFKACYRLGEKDGTDTLYDLYKMKFFVDDMIEMYERGERL